MNAKIIRHELESLRKKSDQDLLYAWVLAYLEQNGPTLFDQILRDMNAKKGQLYKLCTRMKKEGRLYVYNVRDGIDYRKIWSLTPRGPIPKRPLINRLPDIGIESEHLEWMAYWRLPRAERRAIECKRQAGIQS